jgi:bifunctional non-homologous end joining protein LigD
MKGNTRDRPIVAGVPISHSDRLIYPELGITKLDLARFYESVGDWIVRHVKGRPLTLVHCPNGLIGECHYLRHAKAWGPGMLRRVKIQEKTKVGEYLVADDVVGVVGLIQMGIVEIHTWNSTANLVERPNRIVWDLDPGPNIGWRDVVAAARGVRDVLTALRLQSWVKTTGGRGLHVVAPIARHRDWTECLAFSEAVATLMVRTNPDLYTTAFAKHGRESKILVDYLRNNRTNTSIAAFSTRARRDALISMPISWEELTSRLTPSQFCISRVKRRLARVLEDPWAEYWPCRQTISAAVMKAVTSLKSRR